eukprot:TRINITY_DN10524_c0_g1_i1.p1 TRINITY_DN10524_c0_g1~~TRINITY_DN10524_c0_g1_i1.p1  ORF type:complete len:266 (+),score=30.32 TRINITY_DN10524_c0_g1_i1:48-845(+)
MHISVAVTTLLLAFLSQQTLCQQYITQKAHSTGTKIADLTYSVHYDKTLNVTGYMAVVANPINHFHVYFSNNGSGSCWGREGTDVQAKKNNCLFAVNGGPFSFNDPTCVGNIVSDGKIVLVEKTDNRNFGLTKDGVFVMGNLTEHEIKTLGFTQLVTGFNWLAREGKNVVPVGGPVAPRTMIATDVEGRLLLLEVDGIEAVKVGLTLHQAAAFFLRLGAYNAINLDGGGSSATWYDGKIVDTPTCQDTPSPVCVRAVTTIMCITN